MFATIQKWGNSQGIRIPKIMLENLGMRENDRVEMVQENGIITIRKAPGNRHKTIEERLVAFYGKPLEEIEPIDNEEYQWGEPVGEEVW